MAWLLGNNCLALRIGRDIFLDFKVVAGTAQMGKYKILFWRHSHAAAHSNNNPFFFYLSPPD